MKSKRKGIARKGWEGWGARLKGEAQTRAEGGKKDKVGTMGEILVLNAATNSFDDGRA
jgi:hypothetical protein